MTLITTKTITTITIIELPVFSPLGVILQYNVSPHLQEQSVLPTQVALPVPPHFVAQLLPLKTPISLQNGVFDVGDV